MISYIHINASAVLQVANALVETSKFKVHKFLKSKIILLLFMFVEIIYLGTLVSIGKASALSSDIPKSGDTVITKVISKADVIADVPSVRLAAFIDGDGISNIEEIDELVHPDFINNDPTTAALRDIPSMKQFIKTITQAFPDHHHETVNFPHNPGSYMAVKEKELACVQVYPLGTQIIPGSEQDGCNFGRSPQPIQFSLFHAAIFVPS